jgi:hypothetical protein
LSQLNTVKGGHRGASPPQAFDDPADGAARLRGIREVVHDVCIGVVEHVLRVEAVPFFRHGHRRRCEVSRAVMRANAVFVSARRPAARGCADDSVRAGAAPSSYQRVQALLGLERDRAGPVLLS